MVYTLKQTTISLAETEVEAKGLIQTAKEDTTGYVIEETIKRKEKKNEVYFIVTITTEIFREKDITDQWGQA